MFSASRCLSIGAGHEGVRRHVVEAVEDRLHEFLAFERIVARVEIIVDIAFIFVIIFIAVIAVATAGICLALLELVDELEHLIKTYDPGVILFVVAALLLPVFQSAGTI